MQSLVLLGRWLLDLSLLSPLALLNLNGISSLLLQASGAHGCDAGGLDGSLASFATASTAVLMSSFILFALVLLLHDFLLPSTRLFGKLALFVLDVLCMLLDHLEL